MTLSPTATASATVAPCSTASWCTHHEAMEWGGLVHLSDLHVEDSGNASMIKAYSYADGEPVGGASLLLLTPTAGTDVPADAWRLDYVRQLAAVA